MPKYHVSGVVTISIYTEVEANSEEEALEIAINRDLTAIYDSDDPEREWVTSGELDGTPQEIEVVEDK